MFPSISLATPNTTVTSSFTADETCTVGVGDGYVTRVNGQATTSRSIDLVANDTIELDVTAPASSQTIFIPWSYNGNDCQFAVVSAETSTRHSLSIHYKNLYWPDFPVTVSHLGTWKNATTSAALNFSASAYYTTQTSNLGVVIDPKDETVIFVRASDGKDVVRLRPAAKPIGYAPLWNGSTGFWQPYILCDNGRVYKYDMTSITQIFITPGVIIDGARSLWSDGSSLFVGGDGFVKRLSDVNTIEATYSVPDRVVGGATVANTTMFITNTGLLYGIIDGTVTQIHSASMMGYPAAFQNCIVVPVPEEYALKVYDATGTFVKDIPTGDDLPMAVSADGNATLAVSYADSLMAQTLTSLDDPEFTTWNFTYKVSFATPVDDALLADHYLREFTITVPPNPMVSGINFPSWVAPINVDTGTGEQIADTDVDGLPVAAASNSQLLINGETGSTLIPGGRVQMIMRSSEGRKSTACSLGNYAFDFVTKGVTTESFSTYINIPNKLKSSQLVYNLIVPDKVVAAPIALSHGTLKVNGVVYGGSTPVNAGDSLNITLNVPDDALTYYSMLSIADSQFALIVNNATNRVMDIQRYQDYSSLNTVSTITLDETGTYDFPNYSDAKVLKGGEQLTFPTTLMTGDEVEIHHVRTSSWWIDERDTIIIGPNTNFVVESFSTVDDQPVNVDFGTVHMGIPDFDSVADGSPTISGLSDGYSIIIYSEDMTFSVNGAPPVAKASVKNGDVVVATYTVQNLWEERFVKTNLWDGTVYEFGSLNIDPPLGVNEEQSHEIYYEPTRWALYFTNQSIGTENSGPQYITDGIGGSVGSEPAFDSDATQLKTPLPEPAISRFATQLKTPLPLAKQDHFATQLKTPLPRPSLVHMAEQIKTPLPKGLVESTPTLSKWNSWLPAVQANETYLSWPRWPGSVTKRASYEEWDFVSDFGESHITPAVDMLENFESSFGHYIVFHTFDGYWEPFKSISPNQVQIFYVYDAKSTYHKANMPWQMIGKATYGFAHNNWLNATSQTIVPVSQVFEYEFDERKLVQDHPVKYGFLSWNHDEYVTIDPVFDKAEKIFFGELVGFNDPSAKPFTGQNDPQILPSRAASVESASGWHVADLEWNTNLPLETGGFANADDALAAGTSIAGNLEVETYKQPEGTFSYVIKRETTLVCEIQPSGLIAGAWLIGGG